jgi:hypothetical protein
LSSGVRKSFRQHTFILPDKGEILMIQTLNLLWQKKKRSLGKRLQKGIPDLAAILQPVGEENNYVQQIDRNEIQWYNKDGRIELLFFYISNPREIETVRNVFQRTKDTGCDFACIFVHQWTDGEGNWDVFGLHPQRGLVHWNRFWSKRWLEHDSGPFLKDNFFSLFACHREFPLFSRKRWAKFLNESVERMTQQLSVLAEEYSCAQDQKDDFTRWQNSAGQTGTYLIFTGFR